MNISVHTAMQIADSNYQPLRTLMKGLPPGQRREAAVEWRTKYRELIGADLEVAAKAEEDFFKGYQR